VLEANDKAGIANPSTIATEATKDAAAPQDSGKPEVKEHSTNESAVQENSVKEDIVQKSESVETYKGKDINKEKAEKSTTTSH